MSDPDNHGIILPPYALSLGIFVERMEDGVPVLACDPKDRILGRPGFWHGGVLSGLLEMAAFAAVQALVGTIGAQSRPVLKPVNVSVNFMRGAGMQRLHAMGRVVRAGRRLVNVSAEAWQEDRQRLIASAQMNVLLAAAKDQ